VAYRSKYPEKERENYVLKNLKEYNIDVSQLAYSPALHCQQAESPEEEGCPT
jgi:hypothetical protein